MPGCVAVLISHAFNETFDGLVKLCLLDCAKKVKICVPRELPVTITTFPGGGAMNRMR